MRFDNQGKIEWRMTEDEFAIVDSITGALATNQEYALYELAASKPAGDMVEVGTYLGRSATCFLLGSKNECCKLHVFDNFSMSKRCDYEKNMQQFSDRLVIHEGNSQELLITECPENLSMVFIDADHSYHNALLDSWISYHKLMHGGIFAMHDVRTDQDVVGCHRVWFEVMQPKLLAVNNFTSIYWGIKP